MGRLAIESRSMSKMARAGIVAALLSLAGFMVSACDELPFGLGGSWPPKVGKPFPDIEFTNYDGRKLKIADFKGKVVLVKMVGMTCPACNAFSGGHERGAMTGVQPQPGLGMLEAYLDRFGGGLTLDHPELVLVQIVLYDLSNDAPDRDDVRLWAEHYHLDRNPNIHVVFSERDLRGRASLNMIPGVQLVDKESVVRLDSTGPRPRHNLYTQLLPQVPRLLR